MNQSAKETSNKLVHVRHSLGRSKTELGQLLLKIENPKNAYQQWYNMEERGTWASGTDRYLDLLLYLISEHPKVINRFVELVEKGEI